MVSFREALIQKAPWLCNYLKFYFRDTIWWEAPAETCLARRWNCEVKVGKRGSYNINTSGQNWEWASQQTLHPEFWILTKFLFQIFSPEAYKRLSAMADVLIRSFSKILSLLVGPTNVAIDNWTFQMFYKVSVNISQYFSEDRNFIIYFRLPPCCWELVPSLSAPGLCRHNLFCFETWNWTSSS